MINHHNFEEPSMNNIKECISQIGSRINQYKNLLMISSSSKEKNRSSNLAHRQKISILNKSDRNIFVNIRIEDQVDQLSYSSANHQKNRNRGETYELQKYQKQKYQTIVKKPRINENIERRYPQYFQKDQEQIESAKSSDIATHFNFSSNGNSKIEKNNLMNSKHEKHFQQISNSGLMQNLQENEKDQKNNLYSFSDKKSSKKQNQNISKIRQNKLKVKQNQRMAESMLIQENEDENVLNYSESNRKKLNRHQHQKINLDNYTAFTLFSDSKNSPLQNKLIKQQIAEDKTPKIYNYLQKTFQQQDSKLYTPPALNIFSMANNVGCQKSNFNQSALKQKETQKKSLKWTIQKQDQNAFIKDPNFLIVKPRNNKTYRELMTQRIQYKKNKQASRSKGKIYQRLTYSPIHHSKSSLNKTLFNSEKHEKKNIQRITVTKKADDIFTERKNKYLEELKQIEDNFQNKKSEFKKKYSKLRSNHQLHEIQKSSEKRQTARKISNSKCSKKSISPQIQSLCERLYTSKSKEKMPCPHELRYNQISYRDHFDQIVNENLVVKQYLNKSQIQKLYIKLIQQPCSMSFWPMKILNEATKKMKNKEEEAFLKQYK